MSDRIAVINRGRCVQCDAPERLYKRPRTRFVAEFFRGCNVLEARMRRSATATATYRLAGDRIDVPLGGITDAGPAYRASGPKTCTSARSRERASVPVVGDAAREHVIAAPCSTIGWRWRTGRRSSRP